MSIMDEFRHLEQQLAEGAITEAEHEAARLKLLGRDEPRHMSAPTGRTLFQGLGFLLAVVVVAVLVVALTTQIVKTLGGWSGIAHTLEFIAAFVAFLVIGFVCWLANSVINPSRRGFQQVYMATEQIQTEQQAKDAAAASKACPDCCSIIPKAARVCAHCRYRYEDAA